MEKHSIAIAPRLTYRNVRWNDAAGSVEESACLPCEPGRWLDVQKKKVEPKNHCSHCSRIFTCHVGMFIYVYVYVMYIQ